MFDVSGISWLAVIAAVVANMVLGFLWFGPLFGKAWMAASGRKEADMEGAGAGMYVVPILSALVGAIVLWNVMQATGLSGIMAAFWMWLGFMALTSFTNSTFRGNSTTLWALEQSAHLVGFGITGLLLDLL